MIFCGLSFVQFRPNPRDTLCVFPTHGYYIASFFLALIATKVDSHRIRSCLMLAAYFMARFLRHTEHPVYGLVDQFFAVTLTTKAKSFILSTSGISVLLLIVANLCLSDMR